MPDEMPAAPVAPAVATPAPIAPTTPPAAVIAAPVASPPAAAVAPAPVVEPPQAGAPEPTWLKSRLEQAKRNERAAILTELGVTDPAAAKALLAAAKTAEEAQKTELQKARDRASALESVASRAAVLEQTVKARAETEMAGLTDSQRSAVSAIAGEDSARVLTTIDALKPTWAVAAPSEVVPAATAPEPVVVAPLASTAPPPNAPAGNGPTSPPDRKAEYQSLKAKNPVAAAAYLNLYVNDIYPRA